jgi:hypothetical protein
MMTVLTALKPGFITERSDTPDSVSEPEPGHSE